MKSLRILTVLALVASCSAFAGSNSNGGDIDISNDNKAYGGNATAYGGQGGQGGTAYGGLGGTATIQSGAVKNDIDNKNYNTNVNSASSKSEAVAIQGQAQGQKQGQLQGQAQTNGNGNNWSYTNVTPDTLKTVGIAPTIFANPTANCRIQGGASSGWLSGSFGFSGSVLDKGCDARADVTLLVSINQPEAAILRACAKKELAEALGNKCPKPAAAVKTGSAVRDGSGKLVKAGE